MISFEAIRRLPMTLPRRDRMLTEEEAYEATVGRLSLVASHTYQIGFGAVYDVSLKGSNAEVELVLEALEAEFGPVISKHNPELPSGQTHYLFISDSTEIPETKVHEVLGDSRISEICRKHELSDDDEIKLRDILTHFTTLMFQSEVRVLYTHSVLSDLPEGVRKNILAALVEINFTFFEKQRGITGSG